MHAIAPDPRYLTTVDGALRYETNVFDVQAQTWPDLRRRRAGVRPRCTDSWCHGAPGVGLARWELMRHPALATQREQIADDLARAVRATAAASAGAHDDSLCHGLLGALELLALTAGTGPAGPDRDSFERTVAATVAGGERDGWRGGQRGADEPPGLMCGLAGIGYGLLRLARPARVPSVLLLQPPSAGTVRP